jgi:arylsulfatase A-like enzyme
VSHGHTLYREVLEVPLIVKWPLGAAAGSGGRGGRAQLLDVLSTVLDVVGLPSPPGIEGRSLRRAPPADAHPEGSGTLSYLDLDGQRLQAVTQDRWKLIRTGALDAPRAPLRLYDASSDSDERNDTQPAHPVVALHLAAQLAAAVARRPAGPAPPQAEMPPEMIERLRALGYLP